MADTQNTTDIATENRQYIIGMQADIGYIKEGILDMKTELIKLAAEIKTDMRELHSLLEHKYVSKNELTIEIQKIANRLEDVETKVDSLARDRYKIVWMIVSTVILALIGLVIVNPINI